jgi:hypothetical protein
MYNRYIRIILPRIFFQIININFQTYKNYLYHNRFSYFVLNFLQLLTDSKTEQFKLKIECLTPRKDFILAIKNFEVRLHLFSLVN